MSPVTAKDLTTDYPRSPYDQLDGITWLPRVIDKVRALQAGKIGEYTPFPCGGDQRFLAMHGLEATALKAEIDAGKSDAEITAWVKATMNADAAKMAEYRAGMFQALDGEMAEYLAGAKAELAKARPELDLSGADNWARLICAEEGHALPPA